MSKQSKAPPNYDYTSRERQARARARTAMTVSVPLDALHAEALRYILDEGSDKSTSACIRRLLRNEAERLGAPIKREE